MKHMKELSVNERDLVTEVKIFSKLKLFTPVPTAVKEWLFSALKNLKTYLWSTTGDTHLKNYIVLHTHWSLTNQLNVANIATILLEALNLVNNVL